MQLKLIYVKIQPLTLTFYGHGNLLPDEWDPDGRNLQTGLTERIVFTTLTSFLSFCGRGNLPVEWDPDRRNLQTGLADRIVGVLMFTEPHG
jgi:hypothetical protein